MSPTRYIPSDVPKCSGNPAKLECDGCLRKLLPEHPNAAYQTYMGFWIMDTPCPHRWTDDANQHY